jgi:radical SAM-linked protein
MELVGSETPQGLPTGFGPSGRAGEPPIQRFRLTFTKRRPLRFIGHLDLVRMWERAFRRAKLPLAYTLGFTPHPRLTFAAPLALGATASAELCDVHLQERLSMEEFLARLQYQLPAGCEIVSATEVDLLAPPVMSLTRWAEYRVEIVDAPIQPDVARQVGAVSEIATAAGSRWSASGAVGVECPEGGPPEQDDWLEEIPWRPPLQRLAPPQLSRSAPDSSEIRRRIEALLASSELLRCRQREGKTTTYDLRRLIVDVWHVGAPGPLTETPSGTVVTAILGMLLRLDATGSGRPEEAADAMDLRTRRIHRQRVGLDGEPATRSAGPDLLQEPQ